MSAKRDWMPIAFFVVGALTFLMALTVSAAIPTAPVEDACPLLETSERIERLDRQRAVWGDRMHSVSRGGVREERVHAVWMLLGDERERLEECLAANAENER